MTTGASLTRRVISRLAYASGYQPPRLRAYASGYQPPRLRVGLSVASLTRRVISRLAHALTRRVISRLAYASGYQPPRLRVGLSARGTSVPLLNPWSRRTCHFEYPVENYSRRNALTAEALMTDPILTALHQTTLLASHLMSAE